MTHRCCWFLDQISHHQLLLLPNLLPTIVSPQLVSLQCLPPLMRGDKRKLFKIIFPWGRNNSYAHLTGSRVGLSIICYLLIVTLIWIVLPGVSSFFPCLKVLVSNRLLHRTIKRINSQPQNEILVELYAILIQQMIISFMGLPVKYVCDISKGMDDA